MAHSKLPHGALHEVFYSGNGSLTQVLDDTIVARSLHRELSEASADSDRNSISGFRIALVLSTAFWVLLYVVVSAVI